MSERKAGRSRWTRWIVAAFAVLLVAAGLGAYAMRWGGAAQHGGTRLTTKVMRGPLTISVAEYGTIKAREQIILKSEVEGSSQILYIIPEGTRVKEGELLVVLDGAKMEDLLIEREITVQNAEAAFIRSRENLEVAKSQAASDISKAEQDALFAKEDLQHYLEGQYPTDLKQADAKITLADADVKRAAEKLEWSQRLFEEKYISQTELDADKLAYQKATLDVELSRQSKTLLEQFTKKRQIATLTSAIEQANMALDRVKRKATADIVQAEADLRAKESEFERQKTQLAKLKDQIQKTRINAPTEGLVVYASTGQSSFRGGGSSNEPLQEGAQIRERQDLIYLPTTSSVMVEIKIHESSVEKVTVGMPVRITVDALPGESYTGSVGKIAPLPDSQSFWQNPDLKVYNTAIYVDGDGSRLRTGMSCRAEIVVAHYPDALYVPVQSVIRVGAQTTVYVVEGEKTVARPVEIGLDNNQWVRILSGLKEGETVLMNPPLSEAAVTTPPAGVNLPMPTTQPVAGATTQPAGPTTRPGMTGMNGGPRGDGTGRTPGGSRMTPEMRQRLESMTPEERQKMMEQFRQRRPDGGGAPNGMPGASPGDGGDRPRGSGRGSRGGDGANGSGPNGSGTNGGGAEVGR